ncbi:hypothetical protein C1645_815401, partial [Glomus cerebriforme]
ILTEHVNSITSNDIAALMEDESFFSTYQLVRSIWKPIKECINLLEANEATLANCFIHFIKLACAIYRLPSKGLKNNAFHKVTLAAIEIWQGLGHIHKESEELIA